MAFLYCSACNWSQDDFWEKDGYTPFGQDVINDLKAQLFNERCHFDTGFFDMVNPDLLPEGYDEKGPWVSGKNYVAWSLMKTAGIISLMVWKTYEDWKNDPKRNICPCCQEMNTLSLD